MFDFEVFKYIYTGSSGKRVEISEANLTNPEEIGYKIRYLDEIHSPLVKIFEKDFHRTWKIHEKKTISKEQKEANRKAIAAYITKSEKLRGMG